jgi:hypothetical protein
VTSFSIFGGTLPGGTSTGGDAGAQVDLGIQFNITASGYFLAGYSFYVPSGGVTTGSSYSFRLYSTTNGTSGALITGSTVTGSGTWTAAAWHLTALSPLVSLTNGTTYVAAVTIPAGAVAYQSLANFWSSGGGAANIVSGPITAWAKANALNSAQQSFNEPSTGGMPVSEFNASFYGVDINVTTAPSSSRRFPVSPVASFVPSALGGR